MTNTWNTPCEALERAFPLRVLRYRLRQGSGGAGYSPGGEGIEHDLQVLEDCIASLITERRHSRPPGLRGGEPGAPGENWLLPQGDEFRAERLPDKCTVHLDADDVVRMLTPGGEVGERPADGGRPMPWGFLFLSHPPDMIAQGAVRQASRNLSDWSRYDKDSSRYATAAGFGSATR